MPGRSSPYIVLVGATKSGTTSLYRYLADHPGVCPASRKETRFFLDLDYPGRSEYRYPEGLGAYFAYFSDTGDCSAYFEATADYLFSPGTPSRIRESLSNVEILVVLRHPVERMLSWYRHALQHALIPEQTSLGEYLDMQAADEGSVPQHLRVLAQGHYDRYLKRYLEIFPANCVHVIWFDDLRDRPRTVMRQLCSRLGLATGFYDGYEFNVENASFVPRSATLNKYYHALKYALRRRLAKYPALRRMARVVQDYILDPVVLKLNSAAGDDRESPNKRTALSRLAQEYRDVPERVAALIGRNAPESWSRSMDEN